ncbi:CII family regulatory protein [Buttiauxella brennerae ATCC 51605]|uniref:CII family regulatory protein n=1 Tax=Buttiauxella brennerae ATCC 51605 TaxID=1354251 RepID=A0A1B7IQT4_9ENTR|nr:phage regulatory CII family protein [Buttiauxella brennerae]OAT32095.1 CII family regulatory protein [Buttiauxella brennerae ATCC 51605]
MFDYQISKQPHFDDACRQFAQRHNMAELAKRAGMNMQTLRNKLNPEQPHQLTAPEIMVLTDLTEDATLVDGFLAQIHCLPCVPVNELVTEKLPEYVMGATASVGQIAGSAMSKERMTQSHKHSLIESANAGMRFLALAALSVDARLKTNPAMTSAVDTMTGIGATFGLI